MLVVWLAYFNDPWRKGFLPELVNLRIADSRESFYLARFTIEPSAGYGDSCSRAAARSAAIRRGGVFVIPYWVSL